MAPFSSPPLHRIRHPLLAAHDVTLWCKRDDLIHPTLSGNKWRKLKYHLQQAQMLGKGHILSFGGAYSNHIHALAAAGLRLGLRTTGIIRGEGDTVSNPTLKAAKGWGMDLVFVDRQDYRRRQDPEWLARFEDDDTLLVPEGGSSPLAIPGWPSWSTRCPSRRISGCCPAPAAVPGGLIAGKRAQEQILAIAVLKGPTSSPARYAGCIRRRPPPGLAHRAGSPRRRLCQVQSGTLAMGAGIQCRNRLAAGTHLQWQGDVGAVSRTGGRPHCARQQDHLHPHRWLAGAGGPAGAGPPVTPAGALVRQVEGSGSANQGP